MKVYVEMDPEQFEFWGVARDLMNSATEEQRQMAYARIDDVFVDQFANATEVNDLVSLYCDDIFPGEFEE